MNPHTASGTLVADGVLVSCYTEAVPPETAQMTVTGLLFLRHFLPQFVQDKIVHEMDESGYNVMTRWGLSILHFVGVAQETLDWSKYVLATYLSVSTMA